MKTTMKRKATVIILFFALLATCNVVTAQQGKKGNRASAKKTERGERMLNRITNVVNLTKEQKTKVATLFNEHLKQVENFRESTRAKAAASRKNFESKVAKILNKEQKGKFTSFMEKNKPRKMGAKGNRKGKKGRECNRKNAKW